MRTRAAVCNPIPLPSREGFGEGEARVYDNAPESTPSPNFSPTWRRGAWKPLRIAAVLLGVSFALAGCGRYALQGRVIEGPSASVQVVEADDARLDSGRPIHGAMLRFTLDPRSLKNKSLGTTTTGYDGRFALSIDELGAGFLEYEVGVLAREPRHVHVERVVKMPAKSKRILITLPPGRDVYQEPDDPIRDIQRFRP